MNDAASKEELAEVKAQVSILQGQVAQYLNCNELSPPASRALQTVAIM